MKNSKLILILLLMLAITVITAMATRLGQNQTNASLKKQDKQEADNQFPITDYAAAEPADPKERTKRQVKGNKYNKATKAVSPDIVQTAEGHHWPAGFPALPVAQSNAVIIGEVTNAQAYLSGDKTGVYSEFVVRIDEVLKNDNNNPLISGNVVTVEREGGRVRFPSGHISKLFVVGLGMPLEGRKYLFFLTRNEQDCRILTGYELRSGRVFPLDSSGVVNFDAYRNADETNFINEVRASIQNNSQE